MRISLFIFSVLLPINSTVVCSLNDTDTPTEPSTTFFPPVAHGAKIGLIIGLSCLCTAAVLGLKRLYCPTNKQRQKDVATKKLQLDTLDQKRQEFQQQCDRQKARLTTEIKQLERPNDPLLKYGQ